MTRKPLSNFASFISRRGRSDRTNERPKKTIEATRAQTGRREDDHGEKSATSKGKGWVCAALKGKGAGGLQHQKVSDWWVQNQKGWVQH